MRTAIVRWFMKKHGRKAVDENTGVDDDGNYLRGQAVYAAHGHLPDSFLSMPGFV